jgi:Domain of unknown function (DUF1905)
VTVPANATARALLAQGDGTHRLPVKAALRKTIGKEAGDTVHVRIDERIGWPLPHPCGAAQCRAVPAGNPGTRHERDRIPADGRP